MSGKSWSAATNFIRLLLNGVNWANVADNAMTAPYTNLYVSLHTADPGDGGNPTTNEVNTTQYVEYVRQAQTRNGAVWSLVNSNSEAMYFHPATTINFPITGAGGTGCTITHFALGFSASGATPLFL